MIDIDYTLSLGTHGIKLNELDLAALWILLQDRGLLGGPSQDTAWADLSPDMKKAVWDVATDWLDGI